MFPEVDSRALETQILLERTHRLLATDRQAHWNRYGLTGSRFILLRSLYSAPEKRLSMGDIAANMNLGANGVTQLVDAMTRAGLVKRETAEDDKRVIYATLTEEGGRLFATVMPETAARVRHALSPLTEEERETLSHLLARIRMHLLSDDALLEADHSSDAATGYETGS